MKNTYLIIILFLTLFLNVMLSSDNIIVKKIVSKDNHSIIQNKIQNNKFSFLIYPNPIENENIKIIFNDLKSKPKNYIITKLDKSLLIEKIFNLEEYEIKVSNLCPGEYLLTIYLENGEFYSSKFIKKIN